VLLDLRNENRRIAAVAAQMISPSASALAAKSHSCTRGLAMTSKTAEATAPAIGMMGPAGRR